MPRMTRTEVEAFLAEPFHLCRIATVGSDMAPLVVPAWFLHRDQRLYVTPRARSGFYALMQENPKVCFSVDEGSLPYRKVTVRGTVEILHEPGEDSDWVDVYRAIAYRYWERDAADRYLESTKHLARALVTLPFDYEREGVTTWRLPRPDEDPAGIWARRYWEPTVPTR